MRHNQSLLIILTCLIFSGCMFPAEEMVKSKHPDGTVMTEGMTISILIPDCLSLSIRAGNGLLRYYTWHGVTRSAELTPRSKMWNGHYGAYTPGYEWPFYDGINRLIAEEAVLNFRDYDHLLCAFSSEDDNCRIKYFGYTPGEISIEDIKKMDFENRLPSWFGLDGCTAYTDDGLLVSVKKAAGPGYGGTLYVTVFRLLVNSAPVTALPGSDKERLTITYKSE